MVRGGTTLSTSLVSAMLTLVSCGPIRSGQVADQINGMVGLSREHVLSCMGPPSSTSQVATTEVWSYSTQGPVTTTAVMSGNPNFAVGSVTTDQEYCVVNLTIKDDVVVAANYRSRGKLLSPSLPCYSVLHACVPDPSAAKASANATKEASNFCHDLYKDPRLDPLRGILSLEDPPTLHMQSIDEMITDEQRTALDALPALREQCRARIATANPRLWKIAVQIDPAPDEELKKLYDRKITIGQFNSDKQALIAKLQAALASADDATPTRRITYCYEPGAQRPYTTLLTACVGQDLQLTKEQYEARMALTTNGNGPVSEPEKVALTRGATSSLQIPLHKRGGVLVVPVSINDAITLDFVLDSGATDVSVPADVVLTLMRTGTITRDDFLGSKEYTLADGTVVPSQTFRIKSLKVGDRVLKNVSGSISSANGTLLLGQSFLSRFKAWSIDNSRQVLVLD
jgi:predicted aspartyl protease